MRDSRTKWPDYTIQAANENKLNQRLLANMLQIACRAAARLQNKTRQRLSRREPVQILAVVAIKGAVVAKRETQKVEARPRFVQVDNTRLLPIDRQAEAAFEGRRSSR